MGRERPLDIDCGRESDGEDDKSVVAEATELVDAECANEVMEPFRECGRRRLDETESREELDVILLVPRNWNASSCNTRGGNRCELVEKSDKRP